MTLSELNPNGVYSYAEYLEWTFPERVELIKGRPFEKGPSPSPRHQTVALSVAAPLYNFLEGQGCKVYMAPFDVRLPGRSKEDKDILNVVQPDVCVVCDESKLDYKGCLGAPDIVVEILSPGNNSVELKNKYELYEQSGVQEYWVVSPQHETFLVYTLQNGSYTASRLMTPGDTVSTAILLDLPSISPHYLPAWINNHPYFCGDDKRDQAYYIRPGRRIAQYRLQPY